MDHGMSHRSPRSAFSRDAKVRQGLVAVSRRPAFTQAEIGRAVKGARAAGLTPKRIEIDGSGRIVVEAGDPEPDLADNNPWDRVLRHDPKASRTS
jgi:hypothetical protein